MITNRTQRQNFTMVDDYVLLDEALKPHDKVVYWVICYHADYVKRDNSFPSYNTIAKEAGCSKSQAIKSVGRLVERGIVKKMCRASPNGDQTSNVYTVVEMDSVRDEPAGAQHAPGGSHSAPEREPSNKSQNNTIKKKGDSRRSDSPYSSDPGEEQTAEESRSGPRSARPSLPGADQGYGGFQESQKARQLPPVLAHMAELEMSYGVLGSECSSEDVFDSVQQFYIWNNLKKYGWAYVEGYENYLNGHHAPEHDDYALRYYHGIIARGKFLKKRS